MTRKSHVPSAMLVLWVDDGGDLRIRRKDETNRTVRPTQL